MCARRPLPEPTPAGLKIHRAVTEADGAKLRSLLMENNEDVDELDEAGMTPFRRAVRMKDIGMTCTLLRAGANANHSAKDSTALIDAVHSCSSNIFDELLKVHGIDVNFRSSLGYSALFWACSSKNVDAVEALLTIPHIEVNAISIQDNMTPLIEASRLLHCNICELMLEDPRVNILARDHYDRTAFVAVAEAHMDSDDMQDFSLDRKIKVTNLFIAADYGRHELRKEDDLKDAISAAVKRATENPDDEDAQTYADYISNLFDN